MAEQAAHNRLVSGSSPGASTMQNEYYPDYYDDPDDAVRLNIGGGTLRYGETHHKTFADHRGGTSEPGIKSDGVPKRSGRKKYISAKLWYNPK